MMSSCNAAIDEFLKLRLLEEVCKKGLSKPEFYAPTSHLIAHYAAMCRKTALTQVNYKFLSMFIFN